MRDLHVEALGAVTALVLQRKAMIGISGPLGAEMPEIESVSIGSVPLIPVAAPQRQPAGPRRRMVAEEISGTRIPQPRCALARIGSPATDGHMVWHGSETRRA